MSDKIEVMDYVWVVSDKKMKGSGLKRGELLLVTGKSAVPASAKDPYLTRQLVVAIKVDEEYGHHFVPKQDNDYKAYLIDPRNVSKADDEVQARMNENLKVQYNAASAGF